MICEQVKQFVSAALKYADSVAIAVGPTPTPPSEAILEALVTIVSRAAHEAKDAYALSTAGDGDSNGEFWTCAGRLSFEGVVEKWDVRWWGRFGKV